MCQFFSALVLRNGDILWHEATDSYSDLVRHFKLPDATYCQHFAKIAFTPAEKDGKLDFVDVDAYTLKVDENTEPAWFEEHREYVAAKCRTAVRDMIITGEHDLIIGGKWILAGAARVLEFKAGNVVSMYDSAKVESMYDSAKVGSMFGSAKVESMSGSAKVESMSGSAKVVSMYDSAKVGSMYDSANVGSMYDSAKVGSMFGSAKVVAMFGSAKVVVMHDSAKVVSMYNSANVGFMYDSANVVNDRRVAGTSDN